MKTALSKTDLERFKLAVGDYGRCRGRGIENLRVAEGALETRHVKGMVGRWG